MSDKLTPAEFARRWFAPSPPSTPRFNVGDRVVKNPVGWIPSVFDDWGAGEGVGLVVAVTMNVIDMDLMEVEWPNGRACQRPFELLLAPDSGDSLQ